MTDSRTQPELPSETLPALEVGDDPPREVSRIAFRAPPIWKTDVDLWFLSMQCHPDAFSFSRGNAAMLASIFVFRGQKRMPGCRMGQWIIFTDTKGQQEHLRHFLSNKEQLRAENCMVRS
ncbi:hypothetical protein TNIN_116111 [Trichonephila inaurata madagascariensis]|uniref:Uncharacterized protein n=1 Tax=Trichonephila inaurata madagascariensis TaxID=2747483 RepID=A0A8X7BQI0_9ARAC|nr:hypothetical protein TNIN_116111 [Trichonephila inaurata madagascariensis]